MAHKFRTATIAAVVGYSLTFILVYYYSWATSISQDVDWNVVLTTALVAATGGAVMGAVIGMMFAEWD